MNRLTLPGDFTDQISKKMLTAPVPAFFYAKLLKLAGVKFNLQSLQASEMGLTPERSPSSQGAAVPPLDSLQLMVNDQSGQADVVVVSDELSGQGTGHTVRFNRPVFSGGGYTLAARTIGAQQTISVVPIDISTEQVYLTLAKLGGPYAAGGSAIQPYAIDLYDSARSIHSLAQLAATNLEFDREKLVDAIMNALVEALTASQVSGAVNYILPGRGRKTADSQLLSPGDSEFDLETLLRAERVLTDRNVPRLPNGKYMAVLTPTQALQLQLDNDFRDLSKFNTDKNPLYNEAVAELQSIMIYRSTTLTVDTSTVANNSIHHGVMFGAGALGYGIGRECEVKTSTDDNYGNQAKFIWESQEAFGSLDNRYCVGMHSD